MLDFSWFVEVYRQINYNENTYKCDIFNIIVSENKLFVNIASTIPYPLFQILKIGIKGDYMKLLHGISAPTCEGTILEVHLDIQDADPSFIAWLGSVGFES